MIFKNTKIQKIISFSISIFIISSFVFSIPNKTNAFLGIGDVVMDPITNVQTTATVFNVAATWAAKLKDIATAVTKEFLKIVAKRLMAEMTKSTINWVNTGFHGQPLFLENSQSFFQDIAKSEVRNLVDQIGYDRLKFPFGKQFALQAIQSYKTTAQQNAEYSLSRVINDPALLENYRNNFYVGGWDGFLLNTQYPANNPMGFYLTEAEKLGEKLAGTQQNAVSNVKDTLQQGMGFLSPKTCPTNPSYNNGINEFNKPSFSYKETYNPPKVSLQDVNSTDPAAIARVKAFQDYDKAYADKKFAAQEAWSEENTCPGGLVATTPGSVVSSKITKALNLSEDQASIGFAFGNNLSAIFDSLFNHFLDKGLNSLASTINPQITPEDNWSYNGQTLGSPSTNGDSFSGPDQEIILSDFKKQISGYTTILNEDGSIKDILIGDVGGGTYTPGDIENTKTELILISNENPSNPGIVQLMKIVPTLTQTLDQCLPGPDKDWETRLSQEKDRVSRDLQKEAGSNDSLKVKAATDVMRELDFAVASFKDWISTKVMGALPDAIIYVDTVKEIDNAAQQSKTLAEDRRNKSTTLARLQSIEKNLSSIVKQPVSTDSNFSSQEAKLIAIMKQYNAIQDSISNTNSIENKRNELNILKDKLNNLEKLNAECKEERTNAGWGTVDSTGKGGSGLGSTGTELDVFCKIPIVSGFSHGDVIRNDTSNQGGRLQFTFRNPTNDAGNPGYEDLPMVNAKYVYGDIVSGGFLGLGSDDKRLSISIDCSVIFKANSIDYSHAGDPTY